MVVISKDGTIGQIIEINGLVIALPSVPEKVYKRDNKKKINIGNQLNIQRN